jgi:hypothetical protein
MNELMRIIHKMMSTLVPLALILSAQNLQPRNILLNSGFEQGVDPQGIPSCWRLWEREKASVKCWVDETVRRSGRASFAMEAQRDSSALLVSEPIPVAEGQTFDANGWVLARGIRKSSRAGRVAFTVAFSIEAESSYFSVDLEVSWRPKNGQKLAGK